jgi:hypothetical protein
MPTTIAGEMFGPVAAVCKRLSGFNCAEQPEPYPLMINTISADCQKRKAIVQHFWKLDAKANEENTNLLLLVGKERGLIPRAEAVILSDVK